jgi:hypothetical protein
MIASLRTIFYETLLTAEQERVDAENNIEDAHRRDDDDLCEVEFGGEITYKKSEY